ncbi:MAG: signal peptidase I [Bacilli bacterium]|nr:signal peptidase I [Bacilli bacterium]
MKKNIKFIYWIEVALLVINLIFYGFIKVIPSEYNIFLVITFLLLMVIPLRLFFGKQKDKSYYTGYTNRTVITVLMVVGIIIYGLGILLGFTRGYAYNLQSFRSMILAATIVVLMEYFRLIVIKNNYTNYKSTIIFTILLALLEIFASINIGGLNSSYKIFVYFSVMVIPIFAEQFLCSYLTYKVGMKPSLIFKLVIKLYPYLLPIIPDLGNYLLAFVKILTPFIIFYIINRAMVEEEKSKRIITKDTLKVFSIPIIVALVILVILVSGIFNARLIAIATNSMSPTYKRGDAVLIEYKKPEELQKGDILVFKHDNIIVTHRIVNIKRKNNTYYFTTKGDANKNIDGYTSTSDQVIGKVNYVIKYIGLPTVLINEMFERS